MGLEHNVVKTLRECGLPRSRLSFVIFKQFIIKSRYDKLHNESPDYGEIEEDVLLNRRTCCLKWFIYNEIKTRIVSTESLADLNYVNFYH